MSPLDYIRTPKVDHVKLVDYATNAKGVIGTLHLTTTHLIFIDPNGAKETWILYSHIAETERLPITARGSSIRVKTKTFRDVTFIITRERECADVFDTIIQLSNPVNIEDLFAFHYNPKEEEITQAAGWSLYDAQTEFGRMEVPHELWTLTKLNKDYKLCNTYPSELYVPGSVTNDIIIGSAQFRSKGRLPALSYYFKATKTAICRCAQPMAGLNNRCGEDEQLLQAVITSTPGSTRMYIVDTRPKINAMANRAAGKGYENVANYENVDFHFIGIENIHVMRQSLQKMIEVFDSNSKDLSMSSYLRGLDDAGWLKHIKAVMDTSLFIAKAVYSEKRSVLVHCSDGWDRTAQTCSLAEILLDPYYRTIHGFQILVEKEWLAFGHKFVHRCGLLSGDPKEISPIFTQFLEAVWQLMNQCPTAFQFNERFLLEIHEHVYSSQALYVTSFSISEYRQPDDCQSLWSLAKYDVPSMKNFGTFLGNCERERKQQELSKKTYSLWGYMWHNLPDYVNPFYKDGEHGVLQPSTSPQQFRFWRSLYNRCRNNVHPRESVADYVCSLNDHNDSLRDHIRYLEKRIEALHVQLGNNSSETKNREDSLETISSETKNREDSLETISSETKNREDSLETISSETKNREDSLETISSETKNREDSLETISSETKSREDSLETISSETKNREDSLETISSETKNREDSLETISSETKNREDSLETISSETKNREDSLETISSETKNREDSLETISSETKNREDSLETISSETKNREDSLETISSTLEKTNTSSITVEGISTDTNSDNVRAREGLVFNDNIVLNERFILDTAKKQDTEKHYGKLHKVESVPDLTRDIPTFALNWSSSRDVSQCSCGKPIDSLSRKYHCWNCGKVFCARCVDKSSQIPGHYSGNRVPVCKPCFKVLRR